MTSATVTEYTISKNDQAVGHFRKNYMCREPRYSELLKYQPLNEHEITSWGYDEDDDLWENDPENLEDFMRRCIHYDIDVRKYFKELDNQKTEESENQL